MKKRTINMLNVIRIRSSGSIAIRNTNAPARCMPALRWIHHNVRSSPCLRCFHVLACLVSFQERYAALALESRTFGRWRAQSRALSHGLRRLVPLGLLRMFTENELGLLLAGPGDINPDDWERRVYAGGA